MHRMPGQAFSPGARDSAVSAAPCVFLSPQRTARRGRLGGGDRWLEVYYREGKTGENWVKQGRGLSRRAPRPAPCFRAPDAFRAGGAAGNRTRNLRFRKPSLCPVELQPHKLTGIIPSFCPFWQGQIYIAQMISGGGWAQKLTIRPLRG